MDDLERLGQLSTDHTLVRCETFDQALQAARLCARMSGCAVQMWAEEARWAVETGLPGPDGGPFERFSPYRWRRRTLAEAEFAALAIEEQEEYERRWREAEEAGAAYAAPRTHEEFWYEDGVHIHDDY